jgi:hypothetical protein
MEKQTRVSGLTWDAQTRDWTKRVVYEARNRMEAIRWMTFNRDWMKDLRIEENFDLAAHLEAARQSLRKQTGE